MTEPLIDLDRFAGVARLYGLDALRRLHAARVMIVGLGGVGSWAAEALARSGVGSVTLVDMDDVCVSNTNRQVHAVLGNIGKAKVDTMSERLRAINPAVRVTCEHRFFNERSVDDLFGQLHDVVIDAVDRMGAKALLIDRGRRAGMRIVTCGGAGGRRDPSRVRTADLARSRGDQLLFLVRRKLRRECGWRALPMDDFAVGCVFSDEPQVYPDGHGGVCDVPPEAGETAGDSTKLDCGGGFGSSVMVTATFGMMAAALAVDAVLAGPIAPWSPVAHDAVSAGR